MSDPSDETIPPEAPATIPAPPPEHSVHPIIFGEMFVHLVEPDFAPHQTPVVELFESIDQWDGFASEALDDDDK